jgi:ligand-binding sensor protein
LKGVRESNRCKDAEMNGGKDRNDSNQKKRIYRCF